MAVRGSSVINRVRRIPYAEKEVCPLFKEVLFDKMKLADPAGFGK
jgi:hypothetical protein